MSGNAKLRSNRNFLILLAGETLSNSGLWFGILANLQFLQLHVSSDFLKSLILVSGPILGILVSPKAGVIIDRSSKKNVLLGSSLIQLASASVMTLAMAFESVPLMVLGILIMNVGNSFYIPTLRSVIPMVVDKENLLHANAVYSNVVTLTRIGATAAAGILLELLPLYGMYVSAFIIYIVMTGLRYLLRFEEDRQSLQTANRQKIRFLDVFPLLRSQPPLVIVIGVATMMFLFLGGFNLLILKFSEFQGDPSLKGWLYAVEGVAVLAGGFAVRRLFSGGDLLRRNVWLLSGIALAVFIMHFSGVKWAVIAGFALSGFMMGCWVPTNSSIPQLIVPEEIRGRYFAFQEMWNRTVFQLALLLTGAMLDLLGLPGYMLVLSGTILAGFLVMLASVVVQNLQVEAPRSQKNAAA